MPLNSLHCKFCGKKSSRNRTVDEETLTCSLCRENADDGAGVSSAANFDATLNNPQDVDDNETLNNISFGTLKSWFTSALNDHAEKIDERLTKELGNVKKDLDQTKLKVDKNSSELEKLKKEMSELKTSTKNSLGKLENQTKNLETESKKQKTVCENNLKYLVNLDRNVRRENIIIFGVPEDGVEVQIEQEKAKTDEEKCSAILEYIGTPIFDQAKGMFRLGKPVNGKVWPIKIRLPSSDTASSVLKESKKLKNLNDQKIYIKPDKTKAEVAEYQRLGKRKAELDEQ